MQRRTFLQRTGVLGAGLVLNQFSALAAGNFPVVRPPQSSRHFTSNAVEEVIATFKKKVANPELGWLFENCFPNTLDTTVFHEIKAGVPDTYVITGDIDAMWLRDSSAQVWPYIQLIKKDRALQQLIAGVINRQTRCILQDPYANAFYNDPAKRGEWATDHTDMQPGVHERKWEIDSLCYPIRLAYRYWKESGDVAPFGADWKNAIEATYKVFRDQQRKDGPGPYKFQRTTNQATDTLPMSGYGYPVKPVGLICSAFRPSDDATLYSFLVPSNFFAVVSLRQAAEMLEKISKERVLAGQLLELASEVELALKQYAIVEHPTYGRLYAFEVNGFGSYNLMDDANVPSLLALPYLGAVELSDPVYQNTRRYVLSEDNPFFFKGTAAAGIGGPHIGQDMIWPMALIMQAMTSRSEAEVRNCIETLRRTHGGTGFMHESFHKDDPKKFTRSWFAWANTLFGELLWKTFQEKKHLLA